MSKNNSLKVHYNEDVLDLKESCFGTSKSSRKTKTLESATETSLPKSGKKEIRKAVPKPAPICRYPHTQRRQNERAAAFDSRFRRLRSPSPEEDKRSIITVASHYSASLPLINQANQDKAKEDRPYSLDCSFDTLIGEGEGSTGMRELRHLSLSLSKKDVSSEKDDEFIAPSEYCTAIYDTKTDNPNDITTLVNYKYEYPVNQNWGDPRLLKKYKSLFRPRKLKSYKSTWSLPVYTATACKIEPVQPPIAEPKEDNNTYTYEEDDSDGELKKSKLSILYEPTLSWPLYFAACCCGAAIVAFLACYFFQTAAFRRRLRKYLLKDDDLERGVLSKITTNVLSTIVYVLNRIIKTTAHFLVSPRSEVFAQQEANPWWKFF